MPSIEDAALPCRTCSLTCVTPPSSTSARRRASCVVWPAAACFSVLFITHDMSLMVELSHRMAVMHSGRLVEMADSELMFASPLHPYTVSLMNAFPPLTGPRVRLTGLSDAVRAADGSSGSCSFHVSCPPDRANCSGNIPDLREVEPGRLVAEHPRTSIEGTAA